MTSPTGYAPGPTTWRILEVEAVPAVDHPDAWAYHGMAAVDSAVETANLGYDDLARPVAQLVSGMLHQEYADKRRFVAVRDRADGAAPAADDVIGYAFLAMPRDHNTHTADVYVGVHPDHRRHGVGTALAERAEQAATAAGRTTLFGWSLSPREAADDEDALVPATGAGRLPADAGGARFALGRGYTLEQVERMSRLDLPVAPEALAAFEADARAAAGADYVTHTWEELPEAWHAGYARLMTRMSTDVPQGALDFGEETWDAERVRVYLRDRADSGQRLLTTLVEHVPSGEVVGGTSFLLQDGRPAFVFQEETIVLSTHRGHRLGMLVKAVNLRELATRHPRTERVHTFNAEENAHMLSINVALGFRPSGAEAALQKRAG
ncbi:GNAT family N-acetyltransferase [Promicromonospora thailandica]|uniref:Acetyltransferase (GNAT) family protein n=1 Tax=Promicromonospora thailandica TaxID=765201 RepID=A0A9X2JX86_9MICO|nr:GNAT family N-acetyltransferase [Promicromonospora thailandica]MCP2266297.1 Acetyltransferase (GNAT) family protein [Promicromonospora thailandica]BFF19965.1 GNAT family N-acetyltransferase [Promicromonospora thailandica]